MKLWEFVYINRALMNMYRNEWICTNEYVNCKSWMWDNYDEYEWYFHLKYIIENFKQVNSEIR